MSRSAHQRQHQQQQLLAQQQQQQQMADNEAAAAAAEMFDLFCLASTMRQVLGLHRSMCDTVGLRPAPLNEFYPKLKAKIHSWKAQALWKKFDARAAHRAYAKGNACSGTRVLVIGAGPCGLRTAIEAQLLGAKVVVIEKRDRISRNNVLHLWPFVITDLRNLGAKKFYGKFCAGSIDHISIRQLQCILLKVALLLGVEVHEGVSFESTIEPSEGCGWRAHVTPEDHAVSHYEFDVLIGADGKRNTLEGFRRKEFRGKLAIAITANFINKKTEAEAKAEEISGVAFIFNQSFFKELYHTTGIDLENIVYYKDETHYFVMTAKKHSLIDKGVIMQDFADPAELLAPANVNTEKLLDYAREAAEFSTKYQMPNLEFAVNHYGKPDVAMFDFTSMFAAETSCRVIVRKNYRLLQCLVGDSLLEPFWPTGSGCARGFLSSMDSAYAIKLWSNTRNSTLGVLAQRESIYRLLAQTTPENLQRDIGSYTVDPATRYPNLNRTSVNVWQVKHLIDTDDKSILEQTFMDTNAIQNSQGETPVRRKRRSGDSVPLSTVLLRWVSAQLHSYEFTKNLKEVSDCFTNGKVLCALINRYRPDLVDFNAVKDLTPIECNEIAFKILDKELHIPRIMSGKDSIHLDSIESKVWLNYLEQICEVFRGEIPHVKHPKLDVAELREKNRNAAPDFSKLLQISSSRKAKTPLQDTVDVPNVVQRRSVLDEDKVKRQRKHETVGSGGGGVGVGQQAQVETPRRAKKRRSAEKAANIDRERGIPSALPRGADEQFSDRIKSMEQRITSRNAYGTDKKPKDLMRAIGKIDSSDWNVREIERKIEASKKTEIPAGGPKGREKVPKWSKEQFVARQTKMSKPIRQDSGEEKFKEIDQTLKNLDKQLKEGNILEVGERGRNKVASIAGQFVKKDDTSEEKNTPPTVVPPKSSSKVALAFKKQAASEKCHFCKQTVYLMEKISTENLILHRSCLKCHHCHTNLRLGGYAFDRDDPTGRFYCTQHFRLPAKAIRPVVRKPGHRKSSQQQAATAAAAAAATIVDSKTPEKPRGRADNIAQLDLLDRGQTPERIEFENTDAMSDGEPSEEHIIDENEWSGRNFLPQSDDSGSDLSSSDESDDESDSEIFEEANGSPIAAQTLQLATDWIGKQHYSNSDDSDDDFYDSSEGLIDDEKDDTDGEEFKKAREMRREEVRLLPLPANLPTDTETEVQSDSESTSSNAVEHNSATEISTDSEFDHDEIIRETPKIFIDDTHLRKPTKVQIKSTVIAPHSGQKFHTTTAAAVATTTNNNHTGSINMNNNQQNHPRHGYGNTRQREQPQFKPLVQVDPSLLTSNRMPLQNPRQGDYLLNKTASTEGIASKKSLELKKRYLLGEQANGNKIQKSGSTSVLDSKFRSFHSNISECQKLLNPSSDISPSIKTFLDHRAKPGDNNACNGGGSFVATSDSCSNAIQGGLGELNEKIEITIQKPALDSTAVDEKENVFVNSKNELNKGMEYSETINTTLVESMSKQHKCTSLSSPPIIETIDLITPEKVVPIIDLTQVKIPSKMLESNMEFIRNMQTSSDAADVTMKSSGTDDTTKDNSTLLTTADSNKIIDLTLLESPLKSEKTIMADSPTPPTVDKPDVSKDVKETIPDIIEHIEEVAKADKLSSVSPTEDQQKLLSSDQDEEKKDSPEKDHPSENDILHETSIQVPNIPWNNRRKHRTESESLSSTGSSGSSSASSTSSSVEDIQHYILDSTTSPETQTNHMVPRLEVHDSSGTLMQIDSLMIIDGKYVGDPEDLKLMEIPEGIIVPEMPASEDDKTATPEPPQRAAFVSESAKPLPQKTPSPPTTKPDLRFDTKNENKVDTLKNLPLIVDRMVDHSKVIKPLTLSINKAANVVMLPIIDNDKTPTADLQASSKGGGSDSETEVTGQVLTETELSDWTADDCISENFIDMEFVLNSNKGTIKRNKKAKKKNSSKLPTPKEAAATPSNAVECEGILKNLDIDEIEFMDTGSEGSCAESYSATNTALLRNRGYVEFVDNTNPSHNAPPTYHITSSSSLGSSPYHYYHTPTRSRHQPPPLSSSYQYNNYSPVREVLGIDYIEQGAYIMQNIDYDLKTPVNESPLPTNVTGMLFPATATSKSQHKSLDSPSAPLSSSSSEKVHQSPPTPPTTEGTNDLDDDSVCVLTNSQGAATMSANSATNTATTTEESEALTVVTSPLDSFSPKTQEIFNQTTGGGGGSGSSPSSSDKNPKTSTSSPTTTSSSKMPARKLSREEAAVTSIAETPSAQQHKAPQTTSHKEVAADEMSYGDYVRKLQQKITQISNARDSIDVRKQKRKSSKGEPTSDTSSVIENNKAGASSSLRGHAEESGAPSKGHFDDMSYNPPSSPITNLAQVVGAAANTSNNSSSTVHKVPEIPTLTRKLEEITKERTKQKDLIHDLVMDKLQSKKQLNAEKRLTRSRNRSLFGCSAGGGTSVAGGCSTKATVVNGANCTNAPHYHQASSVDRGVAYSGNRNNPSKKSTSPKETKEVVKIFSETVAAAVKPSPPRSSSNKQRPFSENIDPDHHLFDAKLYKLSKTQSFSSYSTVAAATNNRNHYTTHKDDVVFATPVTTAARANRAASRQNSEENAAALTASTEKLRTEARARARLKSNHDLGLSPEEKLQVLRKRYHLEMQQVGTDRDGSKKSPEHQLPPYHYHHHHQHFNNQKPVTGVNDRKMISSKSVNDIASAQLSQLHSNENSNMKGSCGNLTGAADFTSDPNLSQANTARQPTISSNKTNRRHKDPERRKSIIQTFSSFFQKGSKNKDGTTTTATTTATAASAANSAQSERPATSGSCTATATPAEGVFSRFRISPKSREKSKDKDGSPTASCSTTPQHHHNHHHHHHNHQQQHHQQQQHQQQLAQLLHDHHHDQYHERSNSQDCVAKKQKYQMSSSHSSASSPQLFKMNANEEPTPPPIPPLPLNYQRSDDESNATESRDQKKQRAISKAIRQAELKRLRIAQEIQREQEEIEVQLKELEARGVFIEKALRGEGQNLDNVESSNVGAASDEKLLKELLEIWRNITQLKKRDEELGIRQQELQLEHRHAQLKEELNIRLSGSKLEKSSADVAAEGAILNEMLEIVSKRAALRPTSSPSTVVIAGDDLMATSMLGAAAAGATQATDIVIDNCLTLNARQSNEIDESDI